MTPLRIWPEEIAALQTKSVVKRVRTSAGVEKYDEPEGSPIVPHPRLPKAKVPKVPHTDARHTQGQTHSNFVHPVTHATMGKTEVGDTYEQLFQAKMAKTLNAQFGCCLRLITGAGAGTSRTTPLDFSVGKQGGEVKTLSSLSKNQKTAIKSAEVARKVAAVAEHGWSPLLVVQVVDQKTGQVSVYSHPAFESKAVKKMALIGVYHYAPADFQKAQQASGHWDKAAGRAAAEAAKEGATTPSTKSAEVSREDSSPPSPTTLPSQLGRLGASYDPDDEAGGVIEPGDTVIELHEEDDGSLVPYIFTHPKTTPTPALEVKLFGRPKKVETEAGHKKYGEPIGSPIIPHPQLKKQPRIWKTEKGGFEDGKSFRMLSLRHDSGTVTIKGGKAQGFRYEGSVAGKKINGDGFKTIEEAKAAAESDLPDEPSTSEPNLPRTPSTNVSTPNLPGQRLVHLAPDTYKPIGPNPQGNDIPREQWGGPGRLPGTSVYVPGVKRDGKPVFLPARPAPGRWAPAVVERGNGSGYYGQYTADEYVQGIIEGAFDGWSPNYKASLIDPEAGVHAADKHESLPGGPDAAVAAGGIRTIVTTTALGQVALSPDIQMAVQFSHTPTAAQLDSMRTMMERLDVQHVLVRFDIPTVDILEMNMQAQGEGAGGGLGGSTAGRLNRGEFRINGRDLALQFMGDMSKTPEEHAAKKPSLQRHPSRMQEFTESGTVGGYADPNAAPGSRAFVGATKDADLELDERLAEMETLAYVLDTMDVKEAAQ